MAPDPINPAGDAALSKTIMSRVLGGMSVFTMLMTVPQVLTIWVGLDAAVIIGAVISLPRIDGSPPFDAGPKAVA